MNESNGMMRWLLTLVTIGVMALLVYLLVRRDDEPAPLDHSVGPISMRDIAKTEQLKVLTMHKEILTHQYRLSPGFLRDTEERIFVIYPATLHFGFDLSRCTPNSIRAHGDTLTITLPPVQVLNKEGHSLDEAAKRTAIEEGQWSTVEMTNLRNRAEALMLRQCEYDRCYEKAEKAGVSAVRAMVATMGYGHVEVNVQKRAHYGLCLIDKSFRNSHRYTFCRQKDRYYLKYGEGKLEARLYYTPGNISLRELLAIADYFLLFFDKNPRQAVIAKKDNQMVVTFFSPDVTAGSKQAEQIRARAAYYDVSPMRHAITDLVYHGKVGLTVLETDKNGKEICRYR